MPRLRDILKDEDINLYQALETAWDIAINEWIPTLKMESESHGGLPHLTSVEGWMDKVADECHHIWSRHSKLPFGFNQLELYVALAAVLFHDIGRARGSERHGAISAEIIEKHWAQLGIISGRVAHEIGHVCEYHTAVKDGWKYLDTVKIHPWGTVHTQAIASLVCLADELDTAYTRVTPAYVKSPELQFDEGQPITLAQMEQMEEYFSKGLMRDFISAVDLDTRSRLIKTVLFPERLPGQKGKGDAVYKRSQEDLLNTEVPEVFRPEDYFYHFIDHLRSSVDNEILEFLAERYQYADQYKRMEMLKSLRNPDGTRPPSRLLYDLQFWSRHVSRLSVAPRAIIRDEVESLNRSVELLNEIISAFQRMLNAADCPTKVMVKVKPLYNLLAKIVRQRYYLFLRHQIYEREAQLGPEGFTKALETLSTPDSTIDDVEWLLDEWTITPAEKVQTPQLRQLLEDLSNDTEFEVLKEEARRIKALASVEGNLQPKEAHKVLLMLVALLLDLDLTTDKSTIEQIPVRQRQSWSVRDFHTNLLKVLHIYLVNARRLCHSNDQLDFRFFGLGNAEPDKSDLLNTARPLLEITGKLIK